MTLRRFVWLLDAFIRRHRKLSFLILTLIVGALISARSVGWGTLQVELLNFFSEEKYSEGLVGVPQTLNPLFVSTDSERDLSRLLFRGLTKTDFSGTTVGDLAESWEVSSSGQVYLFRLKPNQYFQNGDEITAQDIAATYQAAKDPVVGSPWTETFKGLDIQVVSDHDVLFRLPDPFAPFLSLTDLGVLPKKTLDKISPKDLRLSRFTTSPVGSTDFKLTSFSEDGAQFARGSGSFDFRFYPSSHDLTIALKLGEVKAAGITGPVEIGNWPSLQKISSPLYRRFVAVFFNTRSGATADRNVRYGLSYSLDKNKIAALTGGEKVMGPIPPVSWAAGTGFRNFDLNVTGAKSYLDRSGWTGGPVRQKDGKSLEITLSYPETGQFQAVAEAVAAQWAEVGVRAILRPLTLPDFKTKVLDGKDFQAALLTQEIGLDPDQYVLWHSLHESSTNLSGIKVPKLDKSLEDGRQTVDQAARKATYSNFQRYLLDEAPVAFLYFPKYTYFVSTKVDGINLQPLGVPTDRFSNVDIWKVSRTIF